MRFLDITLQKNNAEKYSKPLCVVIIISSVRLFYPFQDRCDA